jgi:hypothetical protein
VRLLFDAHAVDPRLTKHAWIAEALLELIPSEGYPAARGGFLDAETVWPLLMGQAIGLRADAPDLTSLLKWSLDADATNQFRRSPEAFRQGAVSWLCEKAGPVAEVLFHVIERLERPDAVPIGLAVGVIYHPSAIGKLEKATGKLEERYLGGKSPGPEHMLRWSVAATEVVRALRHGESKAYRQTVQRADEILRVIQADGMAYLCDTSPLGFDQRLARVGETVSDVLERGSWDSLDGLVEARQQVGRHDQSAQETRRLERVDMALRLVRWLGIQHRSRAAEPKSFADAANAQLREGWFVDWARLSLRSGDPVRKLSEAYARLFDQVRQIRQQESQVFAKLLVDWTDSIARSLPIVTIAGSSSRIAPASAQNRSPIRKSRLPRIT